MSFFSSLPIGTKLASLTSLLLAVISLFIFVYLPSRLARQETEAIVEKAGSIVTMTAYSVSPALVFEDRLAAGEALKSAEQNSDLAFIVVFDDSGHVFAASEKNKVDWRTVQGANEGEQFRADGSLYVTHGSVLHNGKRVGRVFLGISLAKLNAEITKSRAAIAVVSFLIFAIGMGAVFGMSRIITSPLSHMVDTAKRIARGDVSHRAVVAQPDEVGLLAQSFNLMVDSLQLARDELEKANKSLEQRVAERTSELREEILVRKRAEDELYRSRQMLQLVLDNIPQRVFWKDRQFRYIWSNTSFAKDAGVNDPKGIVGKEDSDLSWKATASQIREDDLFVMQSNTTKMNYEERQTRQDGSVLWVRTNKVPVHDRGGNVIGVLGTYEDITERKRTEKERKELEAQLFQAQKIESIGTLAAGIAHDFNNILSIILGHAFRLERLTNDSGKLSERVQAISRAVDRGSRLVQQILTFARKTDVSFEQINLNETITELARMLEETFPRSIELSLQLDSQIPLISADRTQLHQTLLNVCVNARDAMPEGGTIAIKTWQVAGAKMREHFPDATADAYLCVQVSDTGSGMDERVRQRAFEPFFTTKEKGKGTGLGLAVVYGIIKSHEGFVDFESETGRGTTFFLYFPVWARPKGISEPGMKTPSHAVGGKETILIVEDEAMLREVIKSTLESSGYRVLTAADGEEALELYLSKKKEIGLVFSDIGLPRMSGGDLFAKLRENNPDAKVILAGGYLEPHEKSNLLKRGAKYIMQKPYPHDEMLRRIREVLDT